MTAAQSVIVLPARPSEHFAWPEFACHDVCGTIYPMDWWVSRGVPLAAELERIRTRIGAFTPTSVYRTWDHHVAIYAAMTPKQPPPPQSGHLAGRAADITCPTGMSWPAFHIAVLESAHEPGSALTYIRFYRHDGFVHVEIRPTFRTLKLEYAT